MSSDIDWNIFRCPVCEPWEAKQERSPVASEPCPACKVAIKIQKLREKTNV